MLETKPQPPLDDGERYVEFLGSSGVAESHCIESPEGNRRVLKVLKLAEVDRWKAVELFEREAEVLQTLDHPGLPTYLDFRTEIHDPDGQDDDGAVTLTVRREWIPGESLQSRIDASRPRPAMEAAELDGFLAEALEITGYLHRQNPPVVHRDVTPEHLLVSADGDLKLIGFGGIQSMLPQTRGGSTFIGTRGYMPVEQMMGRAVPASDLYGLAASAVHLVTGQHPGDLLGAGDLGTLQSHLEEAGVGAAHAALLESMLQPEPEDRPPNADAAARRLQESTALVRASDIELALIDDPPPEAVETELSKDPDSGRVSLTVPQEGFTTKQWLGSLAGFAVGIGVAVHYGLQGEWAVAGPVVAIFIWGLFKLLHRLTSPNSLVLADEHLEIPGGLTSPSRTWHLEAIDAVRWERDDNDRSYYRVDVELDGSTHTVASRLPRPRAVWLADFLQRLRTRRLPDDTRSL